jgi:flagellar hook-associated protein 1 FlgK
MSLGSILSVARTAMHAQQVAIQTAGHNIANVETEGFTRQRVDLTPGIPQRFPMGSIGTGVAVDDVRRLRDTLLDVTYRKEASDAATYELRHELLTQIEGVLGEPSDDGLAAAMDAMWSSWSDLASNPASHAARSVVAQRATAVASMLNGFDARLRDLRGQTQLRITDALTEVNGLTDQIATLNGRIVESETGGKMANDLRDQRDVAVDRLAKLGAVRTIERPDGAISVFLGNNTVVDGIHAKHLVLAEEPQGVPSSGQLALALKGNPSSPIQPVGGRIEAMVHVVNGQLAGTQQRLDALANTLAGAVNAIHVRGNDGLTGATPAHAPFFVDRRDGTFADLDPYTDPLAAGTVTARTIGLNASIAQDPGQIATTSSRATRPTDNDVALAIAGLRTAPAATLGGVALRPVEFRLIDRVQGPGGRTMPVQTSMADWYRAATSGLGVDVKAAESSATVHRTLAEQADQRRLSVSGVNVDEELTTLMRAQQAYAAAAKVIQMADEMMDTLVSLI